MVAQADPVPSESAPEAALDEALQGDDPAAGLRGVVALRALSDRLEFLHVQRARERGWSWQEIAAALSISRQAVHKKYGRLL